MHDYKVRGNNNNNHTNNNNDDDDDDDDVRSYTDKESAWEKVSLSDGCKGEWQE